ncbi:MAG: hypothetical protein WC509_02000 [Candidatus Izemoplasmatales bacterium]
MSIMLLVFLSAVFALSPPAVASPAIDAAPGGVFWNDRLYEYGRVAKCEEPFDGDAWFTIRDAATGALLHETVYDGGNDEAFIYFAVLGDDVFALVTETRGIPGSGGSSLLKTEILTYSADGEPRGRAWLRGSMTAYNNHGGYLVLSTDESYAPDYVFDADLAPVVLPDEVVAVGSFRYPYRAFATVDGEPVEAIAIDRPGIHDVEVSDGWYTYRFRVVVEPIVGGIVDQGEYEGVVTVTSSGELSIDGHSFESGGSFDRPGNHVLTIAGDNGYEKQIAFVIHPYVANVAEGFATAAGVRVFSNADALLVDGEPYVQGELYRIPGKHALTVSAANGYVRTIGFSILPSAAGVLSGGVYEGGVEIEINGTAVLAGLTVTGTVRIDEPGTYELVLYFDGEPYATYAFAVTAALDPVRWWQTFPWLETVSGILAVVGLFLIFRKK